MCVCVGVLLLLHHLVSVITNERIGRKVVREGRFVKSMLSQTLPSLAALRPSAPTRGKWLSSSPDELTPEDGAEIIAKHSRKQSEFNRSVVSLMEKFQDLRNRYDKFDDPSGNRSFRIEYNKWFYSANEHALRRLQLDRDEAGDDAKKLNAYEAEHGITPQTNYRKDPELREFLALFHLEGPSFASQGEQPNSGPS